MKQTNKSLNSALAATCIFGVLAGGVHAATTAVLGDGLSVGDTITETAIAGIGGPLTSSFADGSGNGTIGYTVEWIPETAGSNIGTVTYQGNGDWATSDSKGTFKVTFDFDNADPSVTSYFIQILPTDGDHGYINPNGRFTTTGENWTFNDTPVKSAANPDFSTSVNSPGTDPKVIDVDGRSGAHYTTDVEWGWIATEVTHGESVSFDVTNQEAFKFIGTTTPIPEPSSTALLGLGGLALILRRRK